MSKIVVVGSLNMDLVVRTPRFPRPGETIAGYDFLTIPGGKGANQAVAAARQGAQVTMAGRVGEDDFGRRLLSALGSDGVDTLHVAADPAPTGIAAIVVDGAGQNSIIIVAGANGNVTSDDVKRAADTLAQAQMLVLQLEVPLAAVERAAYVAKQAGVTVLLNPAPAQPLPASLLTLVDYLVPNETELSLLSGHGPKEVEKGARELLKRGVGSVIVTLGERGALLVGEEGSQLVPAYQVPVTDTTAAGDAFIGAFAAALAEGRALLDAVRWANGAGALATTVLGAQPSLPTREAVAAFLAAR